MSDPRCGCYIGNIDSSVSLELLKQCFQQCGRIVHASLNGKETDPYRFGFIDFASEEERDAALRFDQVELAGRKLKVGRSKGSGKDGPTPGPGLRVPISIPQPASMPVPQMAPSSGMSMPMPMIYEAAPTLPLAVSRPSAIKAQPLVSERSTIKRDASLPTNAKGPVLRSHQEAS